MKNVAVMGAGNVGIYAAKAVLESEDMRLCGFIRQKEDAVEGFCNVPVASAPAGAPGRSDNLCAFPKNGSGRKISSFAWNKHGGRLRPS